MEAAAVFAIIEKGLAVLPILLAAGENVIELINRMRAVAAAQAAGQSVSEADLNSLEADLDALIAKFNEPIV
jgi:flagellin-like hook-associated protein FlgL